MSLRQYWRDVKSRIKQQISDDFSAEYAGIAEQYAQAAYDCCVAWYGPPLNPQKPYCLQQVDGTSSCSYMFGKYCLMISRKATTPEQLCSVIAHEMYHRVTVKRQGLAKEMWVQEMMALLSSHWFLGQQGFTEYAEAVKKRWLDAEGKPDISLMCASRRRLGRDWLLRGGDWYTPEFTISVGRISYALMHLLNDNDLRRIIKAVTLEEWIASLPHEKQYGVCRLLEVASDGRQMPETTQDIHQFFNALVAKGNKAGVVAELLQITRLQPASGAAFFHLGRAYHEAKDFQAARNAYLVTLDLKFSDKWLPYNLASTYSSLEDYASAVAWYQEATRRAPDWARALYFLGRTLMKAGDLGSARTAWEKVVTLDDKDYARWAQEALQESLPTDAVEGIEPAYRTT